MNHSNLPFAFAAGAVDTNNGASDTNASTNVNASTNDSPTSVANHDPTTAGSNYGAPADNNDGHGGGGSELMGRVIEQLEDALADMRAGVQRMVKELGTFQQVVGQVHEQWTPIHHAEHQEAERLQELEADVGITVQGSGPMVQ
jgi:hypothetical protein